MSDEELRDHINKIAVEIEKIEQTAKQKETYFTNKCNEEFDPKIKDLGEQLLHQQTKLNELLKSINELTAKKKRINFYYKELGIRIQFFEKREEKILKP